MSHFDKKLLSAMQARADAHERARRLETNDVGHAFAVLQKAMHDDPSYAHGWHCNIAMALFDVMPQTFWMPDKSEYHKICNDAATNFMSRAFQIETSNDMLTESDPNRFPKRSK